MPADRPRRSAPPMSQLDEILGLLNTPAGDRYLFSGRAGDKPATETLDHILNGDGARAGLEADHRRAQSGRSRRERARAARHSGGRGHAGQHLGRDAADGVRDKLASVSALNGATVTGPTGSPAGITRELHQQSRTRAMRSRSRSRCRTARSEQAHAHRDDHVAAGRRRIHHRRDAGATATNLQAALTTAVGKLAATSLSAASAMAAARQFLRCRCRPAADARRRAAVQYRDRAGCRHGGQYGDLVHRRNGHGPRRAAPRREGRRRALGRPTARAPTNRRSAPRSQNIAVYAAMTFSPSDPNAQDRFTRDEPARRQRARRRRTASRSCRTSRPSSPSRRPR